ncbi:MAG: squalene/phytoene synthase family protein [Rhodothermales bacterium]
MPQTSAQWIPFEDAPWNADQRKSFSNITEWDNALKSLPLEHGSVEAIKARFAKEADDIDKGIYGGMLSERLCRQVLGEAGVERAHKDLYVSQVRSAYHYYSPIRFETGGELKQFLQGSVIPRGTLIAKLADVGHTWQLKQVSDLSTAFFLVNKLLNLKAELAKDRLYIPLADLEQANISINDLKEGRDSPQMQKMLWKQIIRVRDAFAQGQPLLKEVPRKFRRSFKKNWLTGLELVGEIEKRNYDLWSEPITLSGIQKFQINVLTFIGRGASHARGR